MGDAWKELRNAAMVAADMLRRLGTGSRLGCLSRAILLDHEAVLRAALAAVDAPQPDPVKAALLAALKRLRLGDCWCECAIDSPMMRGIHTAACKAARAAVEAAEKEEAHRE